jgi:hypothetical protein
MVIARYDFRQAGPRTPAKPLLPITICNPDDPLGVAKIPTYALVDTGAALSALPQRYANALRFDLVVLHN